MKVDRVRQDFSIGDVVRLKSGSQQLVIEGFEYEDKQTSAGDEDVMTENCLICLCTYQHPNGDICMSRIDALALKLERM
jgi:hypothetical protein